MTPTGRGTSRIPRPAPQPHRTTKPKPRRSRGPTRAQKAYYATLQTSAPKRCEMCDTSLPTWPSREAHIAATQHCACTDCGRYAPLGSIWAHHDNFHRDMNINEHTSAWADRAPLREAQPWVRRAYDSNTPGYDPEMRKWPRKGEDAGGQEGGGGSSSSWGLRGCCC
ncbi:hypothetical protein B0H67DRAFT_85 [Lasiosphaeris hirsuta]|uniref:Uncharacterized protein n=1 Tax=Lasiosphaeris hirsuta TaxID=260670 RepID=A0AA40B867_9PEZI|nr:hypothetical protein B0H67DRAFT_85 [Lasiosphaeris hirsuta]